jgi:flagellar biosynthesis regulator FlaF
MVSPATSENNLPAKCTMMAMRKPNEYLVIQAWGEMMHSARSYIVQEQEKAAADNAPIDAVYFANKMWVRLDEITNPDARRRINERLVDLRKNLKT